MERSFTESTRRTFWNVSIGDLPYPMAHQKSVRPIQIKAYSKQDSLRYLNWHSHLLYRQNHKRQSELQRFHVHLHILEKQLNTNTRFYMYITKGSLIYIMNYRFLTTETNSKALYIFLCFDATSSVKSDRTNYRTRATITRS